KSENVDEFLSELVGIGMIKRKLSQSTNPEISIKKEEDGWNMATKSALKNTKFNFNFGKEFEEVRTDDVKVKSLITQDKNKWTHVQTPVDSNRIVTIIREFGERQMTTMATVNGVTCVEVFDRL
ncbi:allergen Ale o 13, partial [Mariannaea sp. PMI_226]